MSRPSIRLMARVRREFAAHPFIGRLKDKRDLARELAEERHAQRKRPW